MPDMVEVLLKTIQTRVLVVLHLLPHSAEVHRVFDHVQVIWHLDLCVCVCVCGVNVYESQEGSQSHGLDSSLQKRVAPNVYRGSQKHYWWKLYTCTTCFDN